MCPFRVHIADLTESAGRLSARKGGRTLLEQELHVDGIHRYKNTGKGSDTAANHDCIGKQPPVFVRGRLDELMLPRRCVPWLLQTADSFTSIPLERAAFKIDDHKDMLHFQRRFVV